METITRTKTEAAKVAEAIRKELKAAYPSIKFSVRSQNYSGGDSVDVKWIDGPSSKSVEKITKKYQYGHFDGMTDCYEYSNKQTGIPQAKFVFASRELSVETRTRLENEIRARYGFPQDQEAYKRIDQGMGYYTSINDIMFREYGEVDL